MNLNRKIELTVGCTDYLVSEVESQRRQIKILSAENKVMNNFFKLVDRLEGKPSQAYGEDRLWQAKKEIKEAVDKLNKND